ncbi:C2H2-type zinc finger protein [Geoglobus ahangari]
MVYICPYCGREYSKKSYFAKHMREKHGVERPFESITKQAEPEPFTVKPPEMPSKQANKVKIPVKGEKRREEVRKSMEEAKYECGNCGYGFDRKYKHCPNCGARFDWSAVEE